MTLSLTSEQLKKFNISDDMVNTGLNYDGVNLYCTDFTSFEKQKIKYAISLFDIFGLGGKAYSEIAKLIDKPEDLFLLTNDDDKIKTLKTKMGAVKTQTLITGLEGFAVNGIELWKLVMCLMVDDCGKTISKQFANYYAKEFCDLDVDYSFDGLQKSVINELKEKSNQLNAMIGKLNFSNFNIIYPEKQVTSSLDNIITYVMTGSPKEFGFKTKSEFSAKLSPNWLEQKALTDSTMYLITDDLASKSSKMKKAQKLGCKVILYTDELFNF